MLVGLLPLVFALLAPDATQVARVESSGVSHEDARLIVSAATVFATEDLSVDLLLAISDVESRFDARSTSRMVGERRKTRPRLARPRLW